MKKLIILIISLSILYSCNKIDNTFDKNENFNTWNILKENENYNDEENNNYIFWETQKIIDEDNNNIVKTEAEFLEGLDVNWNESINNKEITNYWNLTLDQINKELLEKDIYFNNSYQKNNLFIDLWFDKDVNKLIKILILVKDISIDWKIGLLTLHCNDINFNSDILNILKWLNIQMLSLDDQCWFKKNEFSWTWYDKTQVVNFLRETDYINEIEIWHVTMDYFKKDNLGIKFLSWNKNDWEYISK